MKKMLLSVMLVSCLASQVSHLNAQNNIGIGTVTPNAKSLLDLTANDKGFLVPRVTSAERIAINPTGNADAALLVYDTNDNLFYFWNSTQWVPFPQPGSNNIALTFDAATGTLSLTDAGGTLTTNIPPDNDNDPTNEIQQLTLNGNILNLSLSNNNIDLTQFLDNTDNQTLSLNNNTLAISNGNSVDLSPYVNTDNQTLSLNGQVLSISNGNSVTLVDNVNDADSDPTNELQIISVTSPANNTDVTYTLTPAGNTVVVNDGDWQFSGNNIYNLNSGGVRIGFPAFPSQCGGATQPDAASVKLSVVGGFSLFGSYNNDPVVNAAAPPTSWIGGVGSLAIGMNRSAGTSNVDFWNTTDPRNGGPAMQLNDRGFNWRNFRDNGTTCAEQLLMTLDGNGNLTLNQVTGAGGRVSAYGYFTLSDARAKTNLKNIDNNIVSKLMQLQPVEYNYVAMTYEPGSKLNFTTTATSEKEIGFIAQEVYKLFPHLVNKPEDESVALWSVDYAKLTPLLLAAIQQQQKTIETLQQHNKDLQSETSLLKNITSELSNRLQVIESIYSAK